MTTRLVYLVSHLRPSCSAKQVVLLAQNLPPDSFDVHVCAFQSGGSLEQELRQHGIDVHVLGWKNRFDLRQIWRLRHYLRDLSPDIVHTSQPLANCLGRLAGTMAGVRHLVVSRHETEGKPTYWRSMMNLVSRWQTTQIVCSTEALKQLEIRRFAAEKLAVIPFGLPPPIMKYGDRGHLLDLLGLPPTSRLVGVLGHLEPRLRFKDIIWAMDILKVIRDDVFLLIMGRGPSEWRLQRFQRQVQITDQVRFLTNEAHVSAALYHLDCFCSPGKLLGMKTSVMEAMVSGIPVVASDSPGHRALIEREKTGLLASVGDRAGFARQIQLLLDDHQLSATIGQHARESVTARFSAKKMVDAFRNVYESTLS